MAVKEQSLKLDVTLEMLAPVEKAFQAFFDSVALGEWLATTRAIAVPRLLGPYVLEWPISTERDEVLGRTGGVFRATVSGSTWGLTQIASDGGRWLSTAVAPDGTLTASWLGSSGLNLTDL